MSKASCSDHLLRLLTFSLRLRKTRSHTVHHSFRPFCHDEEQFLPAMSEKNLSVLISSPADSPFLVVVRYSSRSFWGRFALVSWRKLSDPFKLEKSYLPIFSVCFFMCCVAFTMDALYCTDNASDLCRIPTANVLKQICHSKSCPGLSLRPCHYYLAKSKSLPMKKNSFHTTS